ncbi:Hypothetical protein AA314_09797 [Archangium gephyra]|uniref:Uncharacterized protein n=1 Tax=Archangium gephyra TaxID=48 RepID=A0AAC8QII9_9BACT|nr:Hypothetical protein AA314_09797 [Archangium gephyra]
MRQSLLLAADAAASYAHHAPERRGGCQGRVASCYGVAHESQFPPDRASEGARSLSFGMPARPGARRRPRPEATHPEDPVPEAALLQGPSRQGGLPERVLRRGPLLREL